MTAASAEPLLQSGKKALYQTVLHLRSLQTILVSPWTICSALTKQKSAAEDGGRMVDLDEFSFGFFETFNGLTEENQMKLKELAEMFKRDQEQRKREK